MNMLCFTDTNAIVVTQLTEQFLMISLLLRRGAMFSSFCMTSGSEVQEIQWHMWCDITLVNLTQLN